MGAWGPYVWEWGSILLRWLHVTAAIAWIGASFFFMHLDASLRKREGMAKGVYGQSWQVHGGGFYEMSKYTLAPPSMPDDLIWHKWQSYWTWISGFTLLVWVYYGQSSFFLIDPAVLALQPWQAAVIGVASLALGWLVYDRICKSPLAKNDATLLAGVFVYVVATSYVYTLVFSPRGALIHTGALMATMMTANVAMIIMPNQRKSIARLLKGESPDPKWGKEAKQRSTHNNYITLPVLFMMLSNHYPALYANARTIPALVTCVIVAGALIRYFYNSWHADHARPPWWAWLAAAAALWGAFWIATSGSPGVQPVLGLAAPVDPRRRRGRAEGAGGGGRGGHDPLRHVPCAGAGLGGDRRGAQGGAARHARAYRALRPGHPHAGGDDPCYAAEQSDGNARRASARCSRAGSAAVN